MKKELLRMESICKKYFDIKILKYVNLNVFKGETLALIGENGAGKSTLIKILCGFTDKNDGKIFFEEKKLGVLTPQCARKLGINFILQDPALVPDFTVAQNIYMYFSYMKNKVSYKAAYIKTIASELLKKYDISLDIDAKAKNLSISQQYLLEIAMAVSTDSKLLVMDETTASLNGADMKIIKRIIQQYTQNGNSVLFISHDLDEVMDIADRITILRDGSNAGTIKRRDFNKEKIIKLLIGRGNVDIYKRQLNNYTNKLIELKNVNTKHLKDISFDVKAGEVVGITGLMGSGKTLVAKLIMGMEEITKGEIWFNGFKAKISQASAINNKIVYIPEDRMKYSLFMNMTIEENIVISILKKISIFGFISSRVKKHVVTTYIESLKVLSNNTLHKASTLSGGNQQKVVLSRWLATKPKVIIADEPTNGLDITSKEELYKILSKCAKSGVGIILISTNIHEILQMCDKIIVLKDGHIKGTVNNDDFEQKNILDLELN